MQHSWLGSGGSESFPKCAVPSLFNVCKFLEDLY